MGINGKPDGEFQRDITHRVGMLDAYARWLMDLPDALLPKVKNDRADALAEIADECWAVAHHEKTPPAAKQASYILAGLYAQLVERDPEFHRMFLNRRSVQDDLRRVRDLLFSLRDTELSGIETALGSRPEVISGNLYRAAKWFAEATVRKGVASFSSQTLNKAAQRKHIRKKKQGKAVVYSVADALSYAAWSDHWSRWKAKLDGENRDN